MNIRRMGNPVGRNEELETYNRSGPKNVTSTTNTAPPEYLAGPLQTAANAAVSDFQSGGGINPYTSLDQQFSRASDLTKGRLDSEFAGSGRNLGASFPARSDELQTLASSIYSPSNLLQFDPTNMLINRLAGIIPGAGGSTQSTQPVFKTGIF